MFDQGRLANEETLSLFTFKKREIILGLAIAILTTPAIYYFFRKAVVDPCEGEFIFLNALLGALFFMVIFWAVIGMTRFAWNEQRHIGKLGNFNRWGHLLFLLPSLALPAMMIVYAGPVFLGLIFLLSLVVIFTIPRQPRMVYLCLIGGNTVLGSIAWVAVIFIHVTALICWG